MEKTELFRFRNFEVYKNALKFRKHIKKLVENNFPHEERFVLVPQILRAMDSVLLNIAEGSEKCSDLDFSRFLNTSLGSLNEVVACLDLAKEDGYIDDIEINLAIDEASVIYKQLRSFSSKVRKSAQST